MNNAPDLKPTCFSAMTRLDHNRAMSILAQKVGVHTSAVSGVTIWGNHSATQYPDLFHASVDGEPAMDKVGMNWVEGTFIPAVQQRGAEIIKVRGASSAASAASAAIDQMRDWALGSAGDDWLSMAIPSDGSYGIAKGLIYSFPVTCSDGGYEIVKDLEIDDFSRQRMQLSEDELVEERENILDLLS